MKNQENKKIKILIRQSVTGTVAGILLLIGSAALLSTLVLNGVIPESRISYCVLGIILLTSFIAAVTARKKANERSNIVCIITGGLFFFILMLTTALLYDARYNGVGETGLLILCGSLLPILMRRTKKKKAGSRMVKLYKKSR